MKVYVNTLEHRGWEDDISRFEVFTTWQMDKHNFVRYYNENIAGKSTADYENMGILHDICRFYRSYLRPVQNFPWLEYVLDAEEDCDDLKFADDGDRYKFYSCCVNIDGLNDEE